MIINRKIKKVTLPIITGMISFYISAFFLLGVLAGYILMRYVPGKRKSIKFSLRGYKIHLHHWLYATLGLSIVFITGVYQIFPIFILGLGGGVAFHGIYAYNDWHKIVYRES